VTDDGAPALPLRAAGAGCRRPYEPLVLARTKRVDDAPIAAALPPGLVLLAPPGPHSRKPRLLRLLRPYVASPGVADGGALDVLELFARELCADATAWGNEPLRFQTLAADC